MFVEKLTKEQVMQFYKILNDTIAPFLFQGYYIDKRENNKVVLEITPVYDGIVRNIEFEDFRCIRCGLLKQKKNYNLEDHSIPEKDKTLLSKVTDLYTSFMEKQFSDYRKEKEKHDILLKYKKLQEYKKRISTYQHKALQLEQELKK